MPAGRQGSAAAGCLAGLLVLALAGCGSAAPPAPAGATLAPAATPSGAVTMATAPPDELPSASPSARPGVKVETFEDFKSAFLEHARTLAVLLPPGYGEANATRYKVLYMNDGADIIGMSVPEMLGRLYAAGKIEPIIVVAIYNSSDRLNEYGVAGVPDYLERGAKAAQYTRFVLEEVLPFVSSHYRTLQGPENTAFMGSSLGGLSAFDIVWKHPDVFGTLGVFSGSFWWHSRDGDVAAVQDSRIVHRLVRESPAARGLRMWFEAGTQDETADRDGNGVIDAIQDTTELMDELAAKGYRRGSDMFYMQVEGGQHNGATWARVMPDFLQWAFPARQGGVPGAWGR